MNAIKQPKHKTSGVCARAVKVCPSFVFRGKYENRIATAPERQSARGFDGRKGRHGQDVVEEETFGHAQEPHAPPLSPLSSPTLTSAHSSLVTPLSSVFSLQSSVFSL